MQQEFSQWNIHPLLAGQISCAGKPPKSFIFAPAMGITNCNHRTQNIIPSLRLLHNLDPGWVHRFTARDRALRQASLIKSISLQTNSLRLILIRLIDVTSCF